ncbi:MAG: PQQ-binding-like beta-propeller repeat protein [Planctomycetes bacterium]|nr:PQQ-binding-like beta-propeller repeat protein [Planctomycetota bacterium]
MKLLLLLALAAAVDDTPTVNWPSFRGEAAGGVAVAKTPVTWNADPKAGPLQNIRWKTAIPGLSHSSPVIWGDRLFVAGAVRSDGEAPLKVGLYGSGDSADDDTEQRWTVTCLEKATGKLLWEKTARQGTPRARRHPKATHANTTLATDGTRVIAFFGSEGLYAYDFQGGLLWKKDLGVLDSGPSKTELQWGHASSPVLFDGKIVLQCDQKKKSFLAVLSVQDGKELWRADREGVSDQSWATPTVVQRHPHSRAGLRPQPHLRHERARERGAPLRDPARSLGRPLTQGRGDAQRRRRLERAAQRRLHADADRRRRPDLQLFGPRRT